MPLVRRLAPVQQRRQLNDEEEKQPQAMSPRQAPVAQQDSRLMRGAGAAAGPAQPAAAGPSPSPTAAGASQQHTPAGSRASLADYFRANLGQQSTQQMAQKAMAPVAAGEVGFGAQSGTLGQRATPLGPTEEQTKKANERGALLGTQGGRQEALRQDYGQASSGESTLDAALLGTAGGSRLQKSGGRMKGLADYFRAQQQQRSAASGRAPVDYGTQAAQHEAKRQKAERFNRGEYTPDEQAEYDEYWLNLMNTGGNVDPTQVMS